MDDKIISGGNEMVFDRHSTLVDVIEQIDPYFDYHLVVVNGTTVDRIDRLTVTREDLKLKSKHESKNQWVFNDSSGTEYTVFSPESSDFFSNPELSDLILVRQIIDDSSTSEEGEGEKKESGSSDKGLDILSEGWTEDGSSSDLYRNTVSPPETIETTENLVFKLNTEDIV